MLVMVMTQSILMFALAGPRLLVTLVPVQPLQAPYFQYKDKLWSHFKAFPALAQCQIASRSMTIRVRLKPLTPHNQNAAMASACAKSCAGCESKRTGGSLRAGRSFIGYPALPGEFNPPATTRAPPSSLLSLLLHIDF